MLLGQSSNRLFKIFERVDLVGAYFCIEDLGNSIEMVLELGRGLWIHGKKGSAELLHCLLHPLGAH